MYGTDGQLLSSYELLSKLAGQWETLDTNTKNYIASTIAGTHQLNNFLALMNNFDHAIEATETALNSAGSAARENSRVMGSLEAKTQAVKATFQDLANNVIESELIKSLLDLANAFLQLANTPLGTFTTQVILLTGAGWGLVQLFKAMNIVGTVANSFGMLVDAFKAVQWSAKGVISTSSALSNVMAASVPIVGAVALAIAGIIAVAPQLSDWWLTLTGDVEHLTEKIEEANNVLASNKDQIQSLEETPWYDRTPEIQAEIDALEKENEVLQRNISYWQWKMSGDDGDVSYTTQGYKVTKYGQRSVDTFTGETLQEAAEAAGVYGAASMSVEELNEKLKQLGYTVEETTVDVDLSQEKWIEYAQTTVDELYAVTQAENTNAETLNELGIKTNSLISAMEAQAQEYQNIIDSGGELSITQREVVESYNKLINVKDAVSNLDKAQSELNKTVSLTADQYYELKQLYPQLASALNSTTEGYELETQALTDALIAGEQWAWNIIKEQKELTDVSISNAKARIQALLLEQEAMLTARELTAGEKGSFKKSGDYSSIISQNREIKELWLQISETEALLQELENIRGTFVSSGPTGGTSSSSDPIKQQNELFKERLEIMEDNLYFMQKSGATEEEQITQLQKMQEEVHNQADWYRSQGLAEDSEYLRESGKKWIEYYEEIAAISEESAQKAKEAWEESINAQIDELQKLAEDYERAFSYVANKAQEEIEVLEKQKDAIQQRYDDEIAALEEENDELERQIELEQALDNLARARQSKVMVYKDGRFQYVEDIDQVSEAQSNLDKLNREEALRQEIENLEESRDAEIAAIDTKIEYWQKMQEEWSNAVDQYTEEQDRLIAEQILGIELEGENWEQRLKNLQEYVDEYNSILSQIQSAEDSLSSGGGSESSSSSSDSSGGAIYPVAPGASGGVTNNDGSWSPYPGGPIYRGGKAASAFADGTLSAPGGLSLVGENGPELRVLGQGDGVIPSDITKNLWAWGTTTPSSMLSTFSGLSSIGHTMAVTIQNLNLPGVHDGQGFVDYMRNNFWRKTLQFQTS